jgi:hypothetical protein
MSRVMEARSTQTVDRRSDGARHQNLDALIGITMAAASVVACIVYEIGHLTGFSFGQSWYGVDNYDEGVYMATGALMAHGYDLYSQIYSAQPPLLTFALDVADRLFGTGVAQARLVILVFAVLGLVAVAGIAYLARGWIAAGMSAVLLVISPEFLVYSHAVEEEIPVMALGAMSLALALVWSKVQGSRFKDRSTFNVQRSTSGVQSSKFRVQSSRFKVQGSRFRTPPARLSFLAIGAGLIFGLAVLTKFFAFALVAPLAVILGLALRDRTRPGGARPDGPSLGVVARDTLAFVAGAAIPVGISFLIWGGDEWRQMVIDRISASTGQAAMQGASSFHLLRLFIATDPGLVVLAVAGGTLLLVSDWRAGLVLASWGMATLAMLMSYHPLFGHHLVILLGPAAVLGGVAISFLAPGGVPRAIDGETEANGAQLVGKPPGVDRIPSPTTNNAQRTTNNVRTVRELNGQTVRRSIMGAAGLATLIYIALLPRLGSSYSGLLIAPTNSDRVLASAGSLVRAHISTSSLVAAGDPWICVDADRLCVPDLVDTSYVRIESGKLTAADAISATRSSRAVAIVLARGLCTFTYPAGGRTYMGRYVHWVLTGPYRLLRHMPFAGYPVACPAAGIYLSTFSAAR